MTKPVAKKKVVHLAHRRSFLCLSKAFLRRAQQASHALRLQIGQLFRVHPCLFGSIPPRGLPIQPPMGASGGSWSNLHIRRLQPHRHRQAAILASDQHPLRRLLEFQGLDLMAEWAGEDVQFWQSAGPCDTTDELHRMPTCAADNLGILRVLQHNLSTIFDLITSATREKPYIRAAVGSWGGT